MYQVKRKDRVHGDLFVFCSFRAHVSFAMCVCGRYLDVSSNQLNGSSLSFLRTFAQLQYVGISLVECVVASAMIRDRGF